MKIKNFAILSIFISSVFAACSTPVNTTTNNNTNVTSSPTNTYSSIPNQIPSPESLSKTGIIKIINDSSSLKNKYDYVFSDYSTTNNLAVDSDHLYYTANGHLGSFNLSNQNLDINLRDCNLNKDQITSQISKFQPFFPLGFFCSDNPRMNVIQGKGNVFYLYDLFKIIKVDGNKVSEIFNGSYGDSYKDEIIVDNDLNIYGTNYNSIRKISNTKQIEWIRNKDNTTGDDFYSSVSIQVDKDNNLYFLDLKDLRVKKMTPEGVVSTIIGKGNSRELDIAGIEYKISDYEIKLAIDNDDNLYVVEKNKNRVLKYDKNTGRLSLYAGGGTDDIENKPANQSRLNKPSAMTFDKDNNAYIIDLGSKSIKKVDSKTNIMSIFIGQSSGRGDGKDLSKVSLKNILSIYSKNNNLYISEEDRIRKLDDNGVISTIYASSTNYPSTILFMDKENSMYINDSGIKKITSNNQVITLPQHLSGESITEDSKGNRYFVALGTIKKVDKDNVVENFAGDFLDNKSAPRDSIKDGAKATEISHLYPSDIVIDSKDNIYAIVRYNDTSFLNAPNIIKAIIRITPDGIVKVLNGNDKDIINPKKLIIDKEDNLYFIDSRDENTKDVVHYDLIKKIDISGNVSVYAGRVATTNFEQPDINNTKAIDALFKDIFISDITIDDNGFLYFFTNENKIYKIK